MTPSEKWKAHKPRRGHEIVYRGALFGKVKRVEDSLCWTLNYKTGETLPFIWCFREALNNLHDWPTK